MADITYEGVEIGFGSPTYDPDDSFDAGFGAPWPYASLNGNVYYNSAETAFADPYANIDIQIASKPNGNFLSDEGGEQLEIRGDFTHIYDQFRIRGRKEGKAIGPFRAYFYLISDVSKRYYCESGLGLLGNNIFTNTNQKQMFFTTPVMPHGSYKLTLEFEGSLRKVETEPTFQVIRRMRNDKSLSLKRNMPQWLNVGHRSDNRQANQAYDKFANSNLSILLQSVAELFNHMYHSNYTVTTQEAYTDSTTLYVETTLDFPNSGTVRLQDGQEVTYIGKTASTLTGISGFKDIIRKNTRVFLRNENINSVDLFYRLQNNGFFRPARNFQIGNFERAMQEIELNERSSMTVIFNYFYYLLRKISFKLEVSISGNEMTPTSETINSSHIGRLCKINNKFFFIQSGDTVQQELYLDELGCVYWNGSTGNLTDGTYDIEILPWIISEDDGGRFTLEIEKSVFNNIEGFIDRDYIDKDIFIDGLDIDNDINQNLNLNIFVASGIIDTIKLDRRGNEAFGTYFQNNSTNPLITITPARELAL